MVPRKWHKCPKYAKTPMSTAVLIWVVKHNSVNDLNKIEWGVLNPAHTLL